jgi:hypothetical protein
MNSRTVYNILRQETKATREKIDLLESGIISLNELVHAIQGRLSALETLKTTKKRAVVKKKVGKDE